MKKKLTAVEQQQLMDVLKIRFEKHLERHKYINWETVANRLQDNKDKLYSLFVMESTGGEPDVIAMDSKTGVITFADCSPESPKERRSFCYDHEALASRKQNKPDHSAVESAKEMGISLMNETQYRYLHTLGKFDTKTSSWLATPDSIRALGGAIFGDYRFGTVFIYCNGAESYYAARGFRGVLEV